MGAEGADWDIAGTTMGTARGGSGASVATLLGLKTGADGVSRLVIVIGVLVSGAVIVTGLRVGMMAGIADIAKLES